MEPKRTSRLPRKLWLTVALVVLGVILLLAQNSTVLVPFLNSYRVIDQRTIAVEVGVSPCSLTRVTNVVETSTEVRVTVETLPCPIPGPGTAALAVRELKISLAADLATRVVVDANGQPVPTR